MYIVLKTIIFNIFKESIFMNLKIVRISVNTSYPWTDYHVRNSQQSINIVITLSFFINPYTFIISIQLLKIMHWYKFFHKNLFYPLYNLAISFLAEILRFEITFSKYQSLRCDFEVITEKISKNQNFHSNSENIWLLKLSFYPFAEF